MNDDKPLNRDKPTEPGKPVAKESRPQVEESVVERAGSHPLGTPAGAILGAVAGAISGLAAGPVGSVVGAVGGALLGGAIGASTGGAPEIDLSGHDDYWRRNYASRPYVRTGAAYEDYAPAYRYGTRSYLGTDRPLEWHEVEAELRSGWESAKGSSRLSWDDAQHAVRDAWDRMRNEGDEEVPDRSGA
jgi:hypothetical protein